MDVAHLAQRRYTTKSFDPTRRIPEAEMAQLRTLLRLAPSSVNAQPWHFIIAESAAGRARLAKATQGEYAYNAPKVLNASHVVVLCAKTTLDDAHLQAVLDQENRDGRFATPEAMEMGGKTRRFYVEQHQKVRRDEPVWISRQVYLALGALLFGAAALGIDSCTMEGFDSALLDAELDLPARGLQSLVMVALGYRAADDFNAALPKSRLPEATVLSTL